MSPFFEAEEPSWCPAEQWVLTGSDRKVTGWSGWCDLWFFIIPSFSAVKNFPRWPPVCLEVQQLTSKGSRPTCPMFSLVVAVGIRDWCTMFAWLKAFNGYQAIKRSAIIPAAGWRDDGVINSSDQQHHRLTARTITNVWPHVSPLSFQRWCLSPDSRHSRGLGGPGPGGPRVIPQDWWEFSPLLSKSSGFLFSAQGCNQSSTKTKKIRSESAGF